MLPPGVRSATLTIEIVLNGETATVPSGLTVNSLLDHLRVDPARVAVEINNQTIRKDEWTQVGIAAGARVEVVHFVGGGTY
jgi:thiamine biosynthesis protein ThiS